MEKAKCYSVNLQFWNVYRSASLINDGLKDIPTNNSLLCEALSVRNRLQLQPVGVDNTFKLIAIDSAIASLSTNVVIEN